MVDLFHGKTIDLPGSLLGKKAVFTSSTLNLAKTASKDNTSLNLFNDAGDDLLHISFRRYEDSIHLTSYKAGGTGWDDGEICPGIARAFGPNTSSATIAVQDLDGAFQSLSTGTISLPIPRNVSSLCPCISP